MSRPRVLKVRRQFVVVPVAPFRFDASFHKPDHFPAADNEWREGIRWQTMCWQDVPLGLKFENVGTVSKPKIALSVWSQKELNSSFVESLLDEIAYRYQWELDLTEFYHRFRDDDCLGPIIRKWEGMRPLNHSSLYEYLIIAIVLQNAVVRRSVNMMQSLFETYGTQLRYDNKNLFCFWSPKVVDRVTEQDLRALKVGYRAKSIKRVTETFVKREINEFALREEPREIQRKTLLSLYGIGPASVGYILFDVFHHMDELDHISPWEQKIYSKLFFDTPPDQPVSADSLLDFFKESFGEFRMLAVHYVWEDLFWRRKYEGTDWLESLIRL